MNKNNINDTNDMTYFQPVDYVLNTMVQNSALRDRRIYLCDEVTRESILKVVHYMNRLKDLDDKQDIKMEDRLPIEIIIDSYGGYVDHVNSLLSTMKYFKSLGYKIITQCNSVAHSCGFMILMMGSERRMLEFSKCMVHQISSGTWGEVQSQEEQLEESKRSWELFKRIIVGNTNITMEQLNDITMRKFDWYMDAETALKLNVIDKILK